MNNREEILKTLKQSCEFLSSEFSVKKIAVFGSVARDEITPDSDVDIVVEFSTPIGFRFNRLVEYLENLLGHKVDVLTKDGIRNIEILGEAAKLLSEKTKKKYPNVPWKDITGTRDKLIHDYFGVNIDVVWSIVRNDIPSATK